MAQFIIIFNFKFKNLIQKMSNKTECIRVAIRCRPLSEQEIKDNREIVVKMEKATGEVLVTKPGEDVPK